LVVSYKRNRLDFKPVRRAGYIDQGNAEIVKTIVLLSEIMFATLSILAITAFFQSQKPEVTPEQAFTLVRSRPQEFGVESF
jgi:hypothetical protein